MKKSISFIVFALISFGCIAQVEMSKEQFKTLTKAEKELYLRVLEETTNKNSRINSYLLQNANAKSNFEAQDGRLFVLTDVQDGKPIYTTTDNQDAALATGTNHLQVGGSLGLNLDGQGMIVAVWDGGPIQDSHTEFMDASGSNSRVTNLENTNTGGTTDRSSHANHVSGTIAARGVNPDAKGMATAVTIRTYNFIDDNLEMVSALADTNNPFVLSNHSYGVPVAQGGGSTLDTWRMGAYTQSARTVDDIARVNPQYLMVYSAGNDGQTTYSGGLFPGHDKLTGDKTAKNNLVVANASPQINPFNGNVTFDINPGSSQGPTDDLRIKPDIAADGTLLLSPVPTDSYASFSGTSMSAPNVTGSLVLLQQYYNQINGVYMNSSTLKGLICHTAVDDTDTDGPDPIFGWGLLDAKRSAEIITEDNANQSIIDELTLANNDTYVFNFSAQAGDKLSATIAWTDVPGSAVSGSANLNNPSPRLVNDLDLRISKDGVDFFPWKLDYDSNAGFSNSKADNNVDNVERIDIDVPEAGNYVLTVSHKGSLQAGAPFQPTDQDFSLILTGNNLTLSVDDNTLASSLNLYPNPNKGEFVISFDSFSNNNEDVRIDIYDIHGRLVFENVYSNTGSIFKEVINLNDVNSGIYIANISNGDNTTIRKIVIE